MELITVNNTSQTMTPILTDGAKTLHDNFSEPSRQRDLKTTPFIEANTKSISLSHLKNNCIIPVYAKDNEKIIAHQEFIETTQDCLSGIFKNYVFDKPEVKVSHQIKGRTPEAIHKNANQLLEHEKTQYFERMAFVIRIPSITQNINGNKLSLMVGGVRALNNENLYGKKSYEKMKFFIGFQNMVCCNLCISSDGFVSEMRVGNTQELKQKITDLILNYNVEQHLLEMKNLSKFSLTEKQFAQLIGKTRLYNYLPKEQKLVLPQLDFQDRQMNTIAKDYYDDNSFSRDTNGNINLWNVYNLFTGANKSSYIDSFLDRTANAFEFSNGLAKAINGV